MWLKQFDINSKALDGVHQQTLLGGLLSIVAVFVVGYLVVLEIFTFSKIDVVSRMIIDKAPSSEAFKLAFDVTFPYIACDRLSFYQEATKGSVHIFSAEKDGQIKKQPVDFGANSKGCTLTGQFEMDKVAGFFRFEVANAIPDFVNLNLSHSVNLLDFISNKGAILDNTKIGVPRSFNRTLLNVPRETAVYQYSLQIVPTQYKSLYGDLSYLNQYSSSEKPMNTAQKMVMLSSSSTGKDFIGVMVNYEFSPVSCPLSNLSSLSRF